MKVVTEYRHEWQKYFGKGSDSRSAGQLKKENPAQYAAYREQWLASERIPLTPLQSLKKRLDNANREREYSEEELRARKAFTKEEVERLYRKNPNESGDSVDSIRKSDPNRYALLRMALHSYGLTGENTVVVRDNRRKPQAHSVQSDENPYVQISDSLADAFHLERGTRVPAEKLADMIEIATKEQTNV